jgi:hypothetical protein
MDFLPLLTVGSPVGVAAFVIGFLLKQYFEKKKDDREDTKSDRESETAIVETTKQAIKLVRDEIDAKSVSLIEARQERDEYLRLYRAERAKANALEIANEQLEDDNRSLARKIRAMEGI